MGHPEKFSLFYVEFCGAQDVYRTLFVMRLFWGKIIFSSGNGILSFSCNLCNNYMQRFLYAQWERENCKFVCNNCVLYPSIYIYMDIFLEHLILEEYKTVEV